MLLMALASIALLAEATTLVRMDLEELTAAADVVARARCLENRAQWDAGEIYTLTQFEVVEQLKGSAPEQITVKLIGGRLGNLVSKVDAVPRFQAGEEVFLFLEPKASGDWGVIGWVQGTFRIERNPRTEQETVTQDTSAARIFDPQTREFRSGGIRKLPVAEFRAHVAAAIERQSGGRRP
jgi:hypothetical protein